MRLRAEQPGLIPLPFLLMTRATVVSESDEPVMRNTTRFDGSYLEDHKGRRGALRFQPCRQPRPHWLKALLQA
ncbi:hypothetical protein [Aeromonas hydrophila]|uniref:hypothetical protein n=1 Tax=Aeromonas hydrophila TaxID=644 RepID=UPI001F2891CB|nr:hypothetical protein [Aeromonas hydrophila]MCK0185419.1 hypothetical protein [Aeromonas hydrophila]UOV92654.1 hypothetical protein MUW98_03200 [Aeromonas hydrophila]BDC81822.1 hypothetical protein NUITMVA1_17650 [Aeromonas hydrophila]